MCGTVAKLGSAARLTVGQWDPLPDNVEGRHCCMREAMDTEVGCLRTISFAKEGPDKKVATFATSGPQVSAMISRVRARLVVSIPLLTKMRRGIECGLSRGCN